MAPQNVRVNPLTASQLEVTWDPPPPESQNGNIQGYKAMLSRMVHLVLPAHLFGRTCSPPPQSPEGSGRGPGPAPWLFPQLTLCSPDTQLASCPERGWSRLSSALPLNLRWGARFAVHPMCAQDHPPPRPGQETSPSCIHSEIRQCLCCTEESRSPPQLCPWVASRQCLSTLIH